MPAGSWSLAQALYERGDPTFVEEFRRIHDAERLADFASRWLADKRPAARQLLIDYLSLPFNAYRHEGLVKRLFKGAEKAKDDQLMGLFLVALDRSIRRQRRNITRRKWGQVRSEAEADNRLREWAAEGYQGSYNNYSGRYYVYATKDVEAIVARRDAMPRPPKNAWKRSQTISDHARERFEKRFVLFSGPTRRYLRRRAWRYFRNLGKTNPERYRAAAVDYLKRYTDADVDSDIHLLDNWGLVHTLFFNSAALLRPATGWEFAGGRTLADLAPAPRFSRVWRQAPDALLDVLVNARCRTVRQWAAYLLRAHHSEWLARCSIVILLRLIDHTDPDVAAIGFEWIEKHEDLQSVAIEAWLARLDSDDLEKLERLSRLLSRKLDPQRVALSDAVKIAMHRSLPLARLGLALLRGRTSIAQTELTALSPLVQAECEPLRPEIAGWLRERIESFAPPKADALLEFLDSKHANVRALGWNWLQESALRDDASIWHKLMESPYDDIRRPLVDQLTQRMAGADVDTVRLLWASVLLSLYGGGRRKPGVVARVVSRLETHPDESSELLPLLAIAVRSLRGPEFRTGLTGVVGLLERKPDMKSAIAKQFPELVA